MFIITCNMQKYIQLSLKKKTIKVSFGIYVPITNIKAY